MTEEIKEMDMDVNMDDDTQVIAEILEEDKHQEEHHDKNPNKWVTLCNQNETKWKKVKSLLFEAKELTHLHELYKIIRGITAILKNIPDEKMGIIKTLNLVTGNKEVDAQILKIVNYIADLALRVDTLFSEGRMRFLRRYNSEMISFSSEECA